MKIIPNEKKYAEQILETKQLSSKPSTEISVLIKYFYHLGLSPEEVMDKMMEFMEEATGNSKAWKMKLKRDIKSKQDSKLNVVEQIHITQTELDAIGMLKNESLERLAFGLLVLLKIDNEAKGRNGEWIVLKNSSELFKDIKVNRNSVERELMIGTLEELGYVFNSVRSGKCAMKINYIDFEGEPAMTITSFEDFIVDYCAHKGVKVINCKECGKRVMFKGRARTQYCPECKKKRELEQDRRYQQQKYKISKNA